MPTPNTTPRPELDALVKDFDVTGNSQGFVGLSVMPLVNTVAQSGEFPKINENELMKRADSKRVPRGGYNRVDTAFDQDTFSCVEYGLEGQVDAALAKIYNSYLDAEAEVTAVVMNNLLIDQELRVQAVVAAQSNNAVGTPWSTAGSCTPRQDVNDASDTIRNRTGRRPTSIVMTKAKFDDILICSEFLDIAKFTGNPLTLGMEAQKNLVSQFLGVPEIIIAEGIYNSADEGQAFSATDIWTDTEAFLFIKGSSLVGGPAFGYTMNWAEDSLVGTESYYEEQTRSDIIRARHWRDEKVQLANAGWKLTSL